MSGNGRSADAGRKPHLTRAGLLFGALAFLLAMPAAAGVQGLPSTTRVTYQGPWIVLEDSRRDTVEILDADGVLRTRISLVGQDMEGAQTSVDHAGNCLVERYGAGGALTLLYFGTDGALKWKKTDHHLQGPFVLSPNGKFLLRTAGPASKFQVFRANDPEFALPNPFAGLSSESPYHADFAADNSVVVFMNPRTFYRVDPATGTILDSAPLAVTNAESLAGANSEWFNDHAANRERTLFLEFVYGKSDDKLVVFDADFNLQKAIHLNGYLNSATFVDSRNILLNVGDGSGSGKCELYLVQNFGKPKLVKSGVENSVNCLGKSPDFGEANK